MKTKDEALKMTIEILEDYEYEKTHEIIETYKEALMQDAKAKELIELYNRMADEVWGKATGQIKGKNNG